MKKSTIFFLIASFLLLVSFFVMLNAGRDKEKELVPYGAFFSRVGNFTTSTAVSVTSASTKLLDVNGSRLGVIFQRPVSPVSTSSVWLSCGYTAVAGNGIELSTTTPRYESNPFSPANCQWNAISTGATISVGTSEF